MINLVIYLNKGRFIQSINNHTVTNIFMITNYESSKNIAVDEKSNVSDAQNTNANNSESSLTMSLEEIQNYLEDSGFDDDTAIRAEDIFSLQEFVGKVDDAIYTRMFDALNEEKIVLMPLFDNLHFLTQKCYVLCALGCLKISELDWWQSIEDGNLRFTATPSQHFSGRSMCDFDKSLWCSWVIKTPSLNLFSVGTQVFLRGLIK